MNGGSDNVNPTITFSGGGTTTQATGTLTVTDEVKTGVYITNGGAGYTSNPTVTISANGGSFSGNSIYIENMPKLYGELPFAGTIVIEVPKKVLKFTRKGELKTVNTFTKSGCIGKLGGLPNIKLIPVNGTEAKVISQVNKHSAHKTAQMYIYYEEVRKYERRGQEILAKKRPSVVRKKMKGYKKKYGFKIHNNH